MTQLLDSRGRPRVVVTGMGVKTPAGVDVEPFWDAVRAGRGTAKTSERFDPSELPVEVDIGTGSWTVSTTDPTATLHTLTGWAVKRRIRLDRLTVAAPTLDEVYREVVS